MQWRQNEMQENKLDEYLDLETLVKRHPQFSKNQLRWLVAKKAQNGLALVIKKIGRRLYFHIPTFLNWMEAQNA